MRDVCFLTTDDLTGYTFDDELAVGPLASLGWQVSYESWWNTAADWQRYESVVIRTPWDYQDDPDSFLQALERIEDSGTRLENPLRIVEWNLNKRYLSDLEAKGIPVVKTAFSEGGLDGRKFQQFREVAGTDEIVIKPTVSATAQDTFRLREFDAEVARKFDGREFMMQPFMESITSEGEYSLFYFNGEFSHAILKSPRSGDFRVQEEHGGLISPAEPETELSNLGDRVLESLGERLLYARIDAVRGSSGGFAIMEVELIEPALYFRMDQGSAARFARAFDQRMNEL